MSYKQLKIDSEVDVGINGEIELIGVSETTFLTMDQSETHLDKFPSADEPGEDSTEEPHRDDSTEEPFHNDSSELLPSGAYDDYEEVLKVIRFGIAHILLLLGSGIALSSDAVEVLSISFALPIIRQPSEFDITNWQNGLLSSVIFIGMLIGGYAWGSIADITGRRSTLVSSLSVNGVFGALSAFSPNFYVLLLFRFISGIG